MTENVQVRALDGRQVRAIELITGGATKQEAAAGVGVDRRTVDRWHQLPDFAAALADARREVLDGAARRLEALVTGALVTIEQIMSDPTAPPATRVRCAEIVLDRAGIRATDPTAPTEAEPADVEDVLKYLAWRREREARDEGDDAA